MVLKWNNEQKKGTKHSEGGASAPPRTPTPLSGTPLVTVMLQKCYRIVVLRILEHFHEIISGEDLL